MSTIYNDLDNDFTLIPNVILQDVRVSGLAFKMYSYIAFRLGRDKKWEFYNREIISHFKEGRDAVTRARNELLELGYLEVIKQNKASNGKYLGNDYIIRKKPKSPCTESPCTENPYTVNQCSNNKDIKNKDLNKKDCNAVQSNFSKKIEEAKDTPSAPVKKPKAKIEETETIELEEASFIDEWHKCNQKPPVRGEEKGFEAFKVCWHRLSNKEPYNGDWREYLKEYVKREKNYTPLDNWKPQENLEPLILTKIDEDKFRECVDKVCDVEGKEKSKILQKIINALQFAGEKDNYLYVEMTSDVYRVFELHINTVTSFLKKVYYKYKNNGERMNELNIKTI